MHKEARVTRKDLEKVRSELSGELKQMGPAQRRECLEAAGEVYDGLAKIRPIKG